MRLYSYDLRLLSSLMTVVHLYASCEVVKKEEKWGKIQKKKTKHEDVTNTVDKCCEKQHCETKNSRLHWGRREKEAKKKKKGKKNNTINHSQKRRKGEKSSS